MKQSTLQNCWIAALLCLTLGATHLQAQNIARGRSFLKAQQYPEAYAEFFKETQLKPQDPEARTLAGLTSFANLIKSNRFNQFMDRLAFDREGRDLDDWTSSMDIEELEQRLNSEKMNGQEIDDFIQNVILPQIDQSLSHFKAIPTGKSFLVFLSEEETKISDVFLDQGDVTMIQAALKLICFPLNGVSAQDMHVDIQSILNLLDDEISADAFMSLNPDFMKNVSQNNLKAARASFIGFIDHYMKGSSLLQNRTTKTLNHLVSIDEEQEELEADFRKHLSHLRFEESLNSLFRIQIGEDTVTVSADPVHLFETPLRSLTRVDGLADVIHQEAEQMATQLNRDIAKLSNVSRARIIKPDIGGEGRLSDGADILLLQGDLQLANSLSAVLSAHDLDIGLQEIDKLRNQEKLDVENVLRTNPALLDLKTPSVMPQVRNWLASARQNIEVGYTLFQARKEGKIGVLAPDESLLEKILETLDTILAPEIKTHELSGPFKESNYLINPAPLWTGEVNLGNLLPRFDGNEPIQGTLPNPTMNGLFPDGILINTEYKLTNWGPPVIEQQPKSISGLLGEKVTFSIQVSSSGKIDYQWYKNGEQIAGATSPIYQIASVSQADLGIYSVRVQNKVGKAYSQTVKLSLPVLHTLTVASRDPESGVTVTLNPADQNGQSDGTTQFTRVYAKGTEVTLSAKPSAGANQFKQWLKNGEPVGSEPTVTVTMDYDRTLRAVYESKPYILTVASQDPDNGVTVTLSPADQNGQAGGTTQFTRAYSKGAEVTLTAGQSKGGNLFKHWLANGEPVGTEPTVTVTMDYNRTLRAVYELKQEVILTFEIPTMNSDGNLILKAKGPANSNVTYQFTYDLINWHDQFTLPMTNGETTITLPVPKNSENSQIFYRLRME